MTDPFFLSRPHTSPHTNNTKGEPQQEISNISKITPEQETHDTLIYDLPEWDLLPPTQFIRRP